MQRRFEEVQKAVCFLAWYSSDIGWFGAVYFISRYPFLELIFMGTGLQKGEGKLLLFSGYQEEL